MIKKWYNLFLKEELIMLEDLRGRASDPRQFDTSTGWDGYGKDTESHARSEHYWSFLLPNAQHWHGRDVLDIGAGTGWLVEKAVTQAKASSALGIEPSAWLLARAHTLHPNAAMVQTTLEEYQPDRLFGVVTAVMTLSHIPDLDGAFKKIGSLLEWPGEVNLIVPDYDYFRRPRNGYRYVVVLQQDPYEYVQMTVNQDWATLGNIVRKPIKFIEAADNAGLQFVADVPMPPTESYMEAVPRYRSQQDVPMTRLLRFVG